jgi:hypothetical protein
LSHTFKSLFIEDPVIRDLFARLEQSLNEAQPDYVFQKRTASPIRYRDGTVIYADGTNWDPGSGEGLYRYGGGVWNFIEGGGGGGTGTVTTVSVVSANGFAGTVATAGTTPAITLTTSITGLLKGNGTAISAATAGTDYVVPGGALGTPSSGTLTNCTFPTLNQNTTGSAAKWTTPRNLAGNSVDGSAAVAFANKFIVQGTTDTGLSAAQFLGALATGIVKNTTTTGVLSIAAAGTDYVAPGGALGTPSSGTLTNCTFPTLNQNTTGTASNVTGTVAVANGGTGDTGTAWTTYTPTITVGTGAITTLGTVSGRYKTIGKTLFISVSAGITTNGTAATSFSFSLPAGMTVNMLQGRAAASTTVITVLTYANAYPGGDGRRIALSGVIEIA